MSNHKDKVQYVAAHNRVRRLWGKADQYPCIQCGTSAQQWSYDGTDPGELKGHDPYSQQRVGGLPMRYSLWPEFYRPLCRSCHKRLDLAALPRPFRRGRTDLSGDQRDREKIPSTEAEWDAWMKAKR
jgi:hypothetical protein